MLDGGCLCGQVRYHTDAQPVFQAVCHCRDCQKQTGSPFSVVVGVPAAALQVTGELSVHSCTGDSGAQVKRHFCGRCGSPIYSAPDTGGPLVFLKGGTLDDVSGLDPKINIWCDSAWPSTLFPNDAVKVPRNPQM